MLARFCFAPVVAASCAGFAGPVAIGQETAKELPDAATYEAVELLLTTESDAVNATTLYGVAAAEQGASADDEEAVDEGAPDAEELPSLWIGVQLATELPPALAHHLKEATGALVETVFPESPAAESGIEAYDLIVRVGDSDVDSPAKLLEAMKSLEAKPVDVVVLRGGEKKTVCVTPRERATAQPNATAAAEASDLFLYNLNVPHLRVLPALTGPDAGAIRHRLVQSFHPAANLPENVESMKIRIEREGDKTAHRVEVTTVDGKVFKAANEEELNALPPEIRAALPLPQNAATFALRMDEGVGTPPVQQRFILRAEPAAVPPPRIAVPAPAPAAPAAAPWVDVVTQRGPAGGDVTYRVDRVHPPSEGLNELKKELSELRASVERIEKLLREKE